MTCHEWKAQYEKWWTAARNEKREDERLPAALAEHGADCARCRLAHATLSASLRSSGRREETPAGLQNKVMAAVLKRTWLPRYRPLPFPALAVPGLVAACLVVALVLLLPGVISRQDTIAVTLILEAPAARSVAVVGDWNSWDARRGTLADEDGDGVWEIRVQLPRKGEYRYQFIINGESWIPDPQAALQVEDGFGGVNSVLDI